MRFELEWALTEARRRDDLPDDWDAGGADARGHPDRADAEFSKRHWGAGSGYFPT